MVVCGSAGGDSEQEACRHAGGCLLECSLFALQWAVYFASGAHVCESTAGEGAEPGEVAVLQAVTASKNHADMQIGASVSDCHAIMCYFALLVLS